MRLRLSIIAAAGAALAATAAEAGGAGCATCYRHVVQPPIYGTLAEHVMVAPARRVTHVIPARYATMARKVVVAPARRVWQETRDAYGRVVGCWVTIPAQYRVEHRHVRISATRVVHERRPALYTSVPRPVVVQPAISTWEPIRAGYGAGLVVGLGADLAVGAAFDPYPF